MPAEVLVERAVEQGIGCLAVTEHNNIEGALAVKKIAPFKVIIGEEIKTNRGEIIGLFLQEEVPRGLSPFETIDRIRDQGGLVEVPHPFDRFRRTRLDADALRAIASEIDIMETFNSRTTLLRDSARAEAFGRTNGHVFGVGSDAHTPLEVGRAYLEMEDFDLRSPLEFLDKLRSGRLVCRRANPLVHVPTRVVKTIRSVKRAFSI